MAFWRKHKKPRKSWKDLKDWQRLLISFQLLNMLTFTVARICLWANGGLAAALEPHVGNKSSQEMTYLIAGNQAQPDLAFEFLMSEVGPNYTYVIFEPQGWSAEATAEAMSEDIRKHDYVARVFAISVGDHVSRYLEKELGEEIELYSINPCSSREALQPKWRTLTTSLAIPAELLCHVIGWPTMIPCIDYAGGEGYSTIMLVDQYFTMAYDVLPLETAGTRGVLLSTDDEYLRNDYLRELFGESPIIEIDTIHADTMSSAEKYLKGLKRLLEP